MRTEDENKTILNKDETEEKASSTLISMFFSLFLVGLALLFVAGFHFFLKNHDYVPSAAQSSTEDSDSDKEFLILDEKFESTYVIIKNLYDKTELCATKIPGVVEEESRRLKDGELVEVVKKGSYEEKTYYGLSDKTYLRADENHVQELKEYIPLEGYIVITYISSSGVRLRSWVDFEADNVVKSMYVGDKVDIKALVVTQNDESAFLTKEGYYITTDSRYFSDYTNLKEKTEENTGEKMEENTETKNPAPVDKESESTKQN